MRTLRGRIEKLEAAARSDVVLSSTMVTDSFITQQTPWPYISLSSRALREEFPRFAISSNALSQFRRILGIWTNFCGPRLGPRGANDQPGCCENPMPTKEKAD